MEKHIHTPGPWFAETEWKTSVFVYGGPHKDDIAGVWYADEVTVKTTREEANANARLIAAAPELLAALSDMSTIVDGFARGVRDIKPVEFKGMLEQARAAIAKAVGVT